MHIVLANQWYPPESGWGGVATYNHTLAHALQALGHEITVIASRLSPDIPSEHTDNGIRVRRLLVRDAPRLRRLPGLGRYVRPMQQLAYSWRVDRALRRLHTQRRVDVVEFADVNAEGYFYVRTPQAPVVVRCHTPTFVLGRYYDRREMPFDTWIIGACEKSLIQRAHALTAPSHDMARLIAAECHVPEENIAVIPNPVCLTLPVGNDVIGDRTGRVTVLHVGRLERVKGVEILAEAIPRVARRAPDARFVFVGDDRPAARGKSERAVVEARLTESGVSAQVEFLGPITQTALQEWYRRADICVVPSMVYESFSYTCAQAMAAGKPVVASRIGGIPETVDDGVSGILFEPGDVGALAEALVRLAQEPALRERMGEAGREKAVREFDPLTIARRNLEVYEQAAGRFRQN